MFQSWYRGNISQHNKGHLWQAHSQHNTQKRKVESLPVEFRSKSRMTTLMTSIQHITGSPSHSNQTRKRNKRYLNRKGRSKTVTSCRGHDTLYAAAAAAKSLQSCLTLWDPMVCSMLASSVLHYLPEFAQTHIYWVGDAIQPSHPLPPPSPFAINISQRQGLFQWIRPLGANCPSRNLN